MEIKRIAIIGGGISGLAVLHHLKQRFESTVHITLYERSTTVGGTIASLKEGPCLFETGPNGFLSNKSSTFELIEQLGLTAELIKAKAEGVARNRYIQLDGQLHPVALNPIRFILSSILSFSEKCALIKGFFRRGITMNQSIDDYVTQRFGKRVAQRLADPFISGIYAGDIKRLHMASVFPKNHGSGTGKSKPSLYSFKGGMGQLIEMLYQRYQASIQTGKEITSFDQLEEDIIICATPAYVTAGLLQGSNPSVSQALEQIIYAPVAVVGLSFKRSAFKNMPTGFGYLIPSSEGKDILGVLIESNVFEARAAEDEVFLRVMLGGRHHPGIINDSPDILISKAVAEIEKIYGLSQKPIKTFVKLWPRGIPQYELNYPELREKITNGLEKTPKVYLCANYLDGVSFNDCINNAKLIASKVSI